MNARGGVPDDLAPLHLHAPAIFYPLSQPAHELLNPHQLAEDGADDNADHGNEDVAGFIDHINADDQQDHAYALKDQFLHLCL